MSMMWFTKLPIMCALIGSLAFCLHITPKMENGNEKVGLAVWFGRLVIGDGLNQSSSETQDQSADDIKDYQFDQTYLTEWQKYVESKLKSLNPHVLCGGNTMSLHLKGTRMPNFMIEGDGGPVPLTQMTAHCGFSVKNDAPNLFFIAVYDGCYVKQDGDSHILPMYLWGMPISMSCPMALGELPMVSCLTYGMVTVINCKSTDGLRLKVNGFWEPLMPGSEKCGIDIEAANNAIVITAPYKSNCWEKKGDKLLLSLCTGDGDMTLSCHNVRAFNPLVQIQGHYFFQGNAKFTPYKNPSMINNIPTNLTVQASDSKQPRDHLLSLNYPFDSMYYPHKSISHRYPWTFLLHSARGTVTTSATVPKSNTQDLQNPYLQRDPGYPWISPTTKPKRITTVTTNPIPVTQGNPQSPAHVFPQIHYQFYPLNNNRKPIYPLYPWVRSTTKPKQIAASTINQPPVPARDLQGPAHMFPQGHYQFQPLNYNREPIYPLYPWVSPTTKPKPTVLTTSTMIKAPIPARYPQVQDNLNTQMQYPGRSIPAYQKPIQNAYPRLMPSRTHSKPRTISTRKSQDSVFSKYPHGYPIVSQSNVSITTPPTAPASDQKLSMYPYQQIYPFALLPDHKPFFQYSESQATTIATPAPKTLKVLEPIPDLARDSQPPYPFPKMYSSLGNARQGRHQTPWLYSYTRQNIKGIEPTMLDATNECSK